MSYYDDVYQSALNLAIKNSLLEKKLTFEEQLESAIKASQKPVFEEQKNIFFEGPGKLIDCGTGGINYCAFACLFFLVKELSRKEKMYSSFKEMDSETFCQIFKFDVKPGEFQENEWFQAVSDKFGCKIYVHGTKKTNYGLIELFNETDLVFIPKNKKLFCEETALHFAFDCSGPGHYLAYLP